ncbi:serine hydrolase domain-containing protein [Nonomuraea rubra]
MLRPPTSPADQTSRRSALALLGAVPLATAAGYADATTARTASSSSGQIPPDLRPGGSLDRFIAELAAEDKFSGTVLLAHRGRTVLSRAYGMADKERSIPNRHDTIYALASASKPFTGLAIVQLVQQGKVRLHERLGAYLDGFPREIADHVTVHQLLTHTSGMGDLNDNEEYAAQFSAWTSAAEVMDGTMAIIRRQPLEFAPGTAVRYSNSGCTTLGAIVAKVSGKSFYDYVRDHVFAPAGMSRSGFYTRPQWLTDRRIAHPYLLDSDGNRLDALHQPARLPYPNGARLFIGEPGGNGFATAPDLVRFALALERGKLLNAAFTELFTGAKVPGPPQPNADPAVQGSFRAYGAPATLYAGHWIFGHGGGSESATANWNIYRDLGWTTAVLCNYGMVDVGTIIDRERRLIAGG